MANNFYEAGLERLMGTHRALFDHHEIALMNWLLSAARVSGAEYWDQLDTVQPNTPFHITIEVIKIKCRAAGLTEEFEQLQEEYKDKRTFND